MNTGYSMGPTILKVLVGRRTLIFFAIFFGLGVVLPYSLNIASVGGGDVGFPYPFYHFEGSLPGVRARTEWDIFATNLAIYYVLAVIMGLIPVLRRGEKS